ncbi:hypothetical protein [Heyndrickxia acidicola]|uniref:Uncharacterized protein n=1 Tax=Heyndrickxia acidicola TaxID=209389 RepID=A0ABU6MEY6_9BACI|nr:hypothetical protein [Heyndrickxia acidicola]MED1201827.1 hypothetical protein [Heyndrickxia acidicola]
MDSKINSVTSVTKDGHYLRDTKEDVTDKIVEAVLERNRKAMKELVSV